MRITAGALILALGVLVPAPASAATRPAATPSPSASPAAGAGRGTSPGVVLVFALLAAAALWQVQRSRRSAQDYARAATEHFERSLEPGPERDRGRPNGDDRPPDG
jgi:ferric-dicitrate binding protein FerR (iron transport regulator)